MRKTKKRKQAARRPHGQELPANFDQQVEQVTAMAMSIIYDEKNGIVERQLPDALQNAQQIVQGKEDVAPSAIANVALWVLATVEANIESKGHSVRPIVVLGAIGRIVAEVSEAAQATGTVQMNEEDVQVAIATAISLYVSQARKEGKVTDQQLMEATKALQKAYPEEAANFQQMIQARAQRQAAGQGKTLAQLGMKRSVQPLAKQGMAGQAPKPGLLGGARSTIAS